MTLSPGCTLFHVDAFADRPFTGNPAVVCILDRWPPNDWLQQVAAEMNQSETAFLVRGGATFDLRWFTPSVEVDLCGHATLASALVLWQTGRVPLEAAIRFNTRSGILAAMRRDDRIELDFPLESETQVSPPTELVSALGVAPRYVGKSRFDYLVEVESEEILRGISPDFRELAKVNCRGVIVTARPAGNRFDFVSRFFAPASGIDEDPVTGSAHCTLASFWAKRLGKTTFTAHQASRRGGTIHVRLHGDRVFLSGQAVIVARGNLAVRSDSV